VGILLKSPLESNDQLESRVQEICLSGSEGVAKLVLRGQHGYRPRPLNVGCHPARFPPRFAASAQAGQAQTAGALAPCRLWYTGTGRQSFRLSPLSASTLGLALLR
jgi:hypothetical protein